MPKGSQNTKQAEINQYTSELLASPAWKYFREEADVQMQALLQDILTVVSPEIHSQDDKLLYTMRDVQCIKYHLIRHFINFPVELLSTPITQVPQNITETDVYDVTHTGVEDDLFHDADPYSLV
jgi:hypothetical protein